uniref:Uncharacterized protein n=1 Tax=Arion vulgaris TaxID=1028688 RepID=A0A0B7B426_9EUPU
MVLNIAHLTHFCMKAYLLSLSHQCRLGIQVYLTPISEVMMMMMNDLAFIIFTATQLNTHIILKDTLQNIRILKAKIYKKTNI